ncbi:MAG: substrate-binding domain-containing protein, partial [Actinobacteria bacterium]|nr:substrate-binding domain-containing protein [Actinomycetota bacterium]
MARPAPSGVTGPGRLDRRALIRLGAAAAALGLAPDAFAGGGPVAFPQQHPTWRFVFVNHALTNPFFVPARYGSQDAAALLGVEVEWTGSKTSDVGEMVRAMRHAISRRVDGIAVSLIDPQAFDAPTSAALARKIPVVSYNADGAKANPRLAYIGQDNYQSGLELGGRLGGLVGQGDVFLFIATPHQLNIQPRIDGALDAIRDSGRPIAAHVVATGVDVHAEAKKIEATYLGNKGAKGLFAVDAGSTAGVAAVMRKYKLRAKGVHAGGYDLLQSTLRAIHAGDLDFAIDQQPYLQGFLPVLQLFLYRYSGGLVHPAETNTGLNFVTRANAARYVTTKSRFEGSSAQEQYPV